MVGGGQRIGPPVLGLSTSARRQRHGPGAEAARVSRVRLPHSHAAARRGELDIFVDAYKIFFIGLTFLKVMPAKCSRPITNQQNLLVYRWNLLPDQCVHLGWVIAPSQFSAGP